MKAKGSGASSRRRAPVLWLGAVMLVVGGSLFAASCGSSAEDACEDVGGLICNDCSGSGDCDVTCGAGETETCVGLQFFGEDNPDDLRCAFCE